MSDFSKAIQVGMASAVVRMAAAVAAMEAEIRTIDPERADELIAEAHDLARTLMSAEQAFTRALDRARSGT